MSDRVWGRVLVVRLILAGLAAVGLLVATAGGRDGSGPLVLVGAWAVLVTALEAERRRRGAPAPGLITPLVLVDGLVLSVAGAATGGMGGPIETLVVLHVVALSVVVSARVGLEAAIWHATLVLVTVPGRAGTTEVPGAVVHAAAYLVVGVVVATLATVDGPAARRRRRGLAGQVRLLGRLGAVSGAKDVCAALADHVVRSGFRRSCVLVTGTDGVVGATAAPEAGPVLVAAPSPRHRGALLDRLPGSGARLVRSLDPEADPLLDRLLPGAANLVGVPVLVDGEPVGVAVAEWRPGRRVRVPDSMVVGLERDCGHAGLALRSVRLLEEVEQRSRRDLLTGLANRRGFDEAVERELSRVDRSGASLGLVLIDLDHFKAVNDSGGHQAGDRILARVGQALRRAGRIHDQAARIGGDEFALLLPDCDRGSARIVAERPSSTPSAVTASRRRSAWPPPPGTAGPGERWCGQPMRRSTRPKPRDGTGSWSPDPAPIGTRCWSWTSGRRADPSAEPTCGRSWSTRRPGTNGPDASGGVALASGSWPSRTPLGPPGPASPWSGGTSPGGGSAIPWCSRPWGRCRGSASSPRV